MTDRRPEDVEPEPAPWGLQAFLGERIPRTWEWKDSLGCVWIVAIAAVLTLAIGLAQLGVPSRVLQLGTLAVLVGLAVAFWLIGRSGQDDS